MDNAQSPQIQLALLVGELAESLSFNKSIGQIYGLLYASEEPLALEEIARQLQMSKGNASVNARILEGWGAIQLISMPGSRRDFYKVDRDIRSLALRRLEEGFSRRLDKAEARLDELLKNQKKGPLLDRAQELRSITSKARKGLKLLAKMGGLF